RVVLVGRDRLRNPRLRIHCREIWMASLGFRLRTCTAQNEASAALVEHLGCACPQLLHIEIPIEADPEKARPVLGLIGQKAPWHFARLVKKRVEQIPCARGLYLRLTIALTLYLSRNLRGIVPRVRPHDLRRNVKVQGLGFEKI